MNAWETFSYFLQFLQFKRLCPCSQSKLAEDVNFSGDGGNPKAGNLWTLDAPSEEEAEWNQNKTRE